MWLWLASSTSLHFSFFIASRCPLDFNFAFRLVTHNEPAQASLPPEHQPPSTPSIDPVNKESHHEKMHSEKTRSDLRLWFGRQRHVLGHRQRTVGLLEFLEQPTLFLLEFFLRIWAGRLLQQQQ